MQGFELPPTGHEAGLLIPRHEVDLLRRVAFNTMHQLERNVFLLRVETLDKFFQPLGALLVQLVRKLDIDVRRGRSSRN